MLGRCQLFLQVGPQGGYHELEIHPRDRYKTAFKTRYGHFEWVVMPFGLTNAPATFQAAMTTEFRDILDRFVLIYLDDILVYSRNLDEHIVHLRTVLDRLRTAKYKANRAKCEFAQQELKYLGHFVTPQGIRPLADKIKAIQDWPEPTNTTKVRSFMGLAEYYQRFIGGYARIAAPLSRLRFSKAPEVPEDRDGGRASRSENMMVGRTCYECGEPDHFASVCKEYWEAKDRGVPFVPPPPPAYVRTGRTVFGSGSERRSHSTDNYAMRREDEETNAMMRSYFREKALMWKQEKENLAKEEEKRKQEALRLEAEKKKQEEIEERKRVEDEQDARLLRIIRSEIRVESDTENERAPRRIRKLVRRNERGETLEEEKERLRRTIALHQEEEAVEDEELILLRRRAAGLVISDKRKREKEVVIGDSPPMITPTKGQRTRLGTMVKLRIEEIRETGKVATSSSPIPEPVGKIALSLKHISVGTGPGAREKYEADCRELYKALTVEELKEACKTERINYAKSGKLDLSSPRGCVYVIISPWYKQCYVGMTERNLVSRWNEHVSCARQGDRKRGRNLYNWLGKVGALAYVAIPLCFSNDRRELEAIDRTLIRTWSPSLNLKGVGKGNGKRRRRGKRERRKKVKGKNERTNSSRSRILELCEEGDEPTVRAVDLLRKLSREKPKQDVRISCNGGAAWVDGWRVVRCLFGESRVIVGKRTRPLRKCKSLFETEGWVTVRNGIEASPGTIRLKQEVIGMFRDKRKKKILLSKSKSELVRYYGVEKLFSEKRNRTKVRRMVSDVFRTKFHMNVCRRVVVKVKYDERIKKSEVVRVVRSGIGRLHLDRPVLEMVRRRSRVVWTRGPNVGDLIHNHRRFAANGVSVCNCTSMSFPKLEGHVHFRIGDWEGCPNIARNAKNIPSDYGTGLCERLSKEVTEGFSDLSWMGEGVEKVEFTSKEVEKRIVMKGKEKGSDLTEINSLKKELQGLVCAPLDRNPDDTLVMSPTTYREAMKTTLIDNEGYTVRKEKEEDILGDELCVYVEKGFEQVGKWKKDGKMGKAYALPKHKDTSKYRPICPTYSEPGNNACKKISRALNMMLFSLSDSTHFNLKSICGLRDRLKGINCRITSVGCRTQLLARSYDIKDMFSKLPHATINRAVDWCIWWLESRGYRGMFVKRQGKGCMLSRLERIEGCQY
ncbi:hypothetical protein CBR_g26083 [Chara braunii]|uniref:CCHC-type domain-containing protein n=1 Tax=Chara braunii TaxID=69332 RepID=A0A388JVS8_CHABU|nr:hypothetical protein CBR_g26083 [Chara braunii]|eukprot:GBG61919.1 hypothetical protein CBR_g26083 [Chara braunii]